MPGVVVHPESISQEIQVEILLFRRRPRLFQVTGPCWNNFRPPLYFASFQEKVDGFLLEEPLYLYLAIGGGAS